MPSINKTIQRLKLVINDENCKRMNQSTVKGYLGELIVKAKLDSELASKRLEVSHLGNQSGYDLKYTEDSRQIKIDVKYSALKSEFDKITPNWGWALQHENKKKSVICTHFVCLAVDNENTEKFYYVVKYEHLKHFDRPLLGQFGKIKHGLVVFESKPPKNSNEKIFAAWDLFQRQLSKGWLKKVMPNQSLSAAIRSLN